MGLFDFVKGIGEKIKPNKAEDQPQAASEPTAQAIANLLLSRVQGLGLKIDGLSISYNSDTDIATIKGQAASQADREKAILAVGNVDHVARVDDQLTLAVDEAPSQFYTVQSGDTLSKIAQAQYGDSSQYNKIFEANQPLLSDPNKIYPGQVLRIPQ